MAWCIHVSRPCVYTCKRAATYYYYCGCCCCYYHPGTRLTAATATTAATAVPNISCVHVVSDMLKALICTHEHSKNVHTITRAHSESTGHRWRSCVHVLLHPCCCCCCCVCIRSLVSGHIHSPVHLCKYLTTTTPPLPPDRTGSAVSTST